MTYDILVLGSGPGGYVAAIRAAQLGLKTAVIERAELGGICLNWGCIPTKALLKSAQVFNYLSHAQNYGISVEGSLKPDFEAIIKRSRGVSDMMSKGVQFLLKKNNVEVISGNGVLKPHKQIEVTDVAGVVSVYTAQHIIIATGARSRVLPNLPQDSKKIIGYREALTLEKQPESMLVVGSGAIGSELAYFYASLCTKVTLVEFLPNIVPNEDEEISKLLDRSFRKMGVKTMVNSEVLSVDTSNGNCKAQIKDAKGQLMELETEIVLSAVGVQTNIENIGLEECGIAVQRSKVQVDDFYKTNVEGYYAIGDVVHGPALAHVASHEALICVEKIAGKNPHPMNYDNIPACTYCTPEIASLGMTEKKALESGKELLIGKFPFTASGKATASGNRDGMVKLIFDKESEKIVGAHLIGDNVTEMISGLSVARQNGLTCGDILHSVHPHPSLSEAIMEAAAAAKNEAINI